MISQCDNAGIERPVAFYSRKLLPRETQYCTVEECLAIKAATQHFMCVFLGKEIQHSDHVTSICNVGMAAHIHALNFAEG